MSNYLENRLFFTSHPFLSYIDLQCAFSFFPFCKHPGIAYPTTSFEFSTIKLLTNHISYGLITHAILDFLVNPVWIYAMGLIVTVTTSTGRQTKQQNG